MMVLEDFIHVGVFHLQLDELLAGNNVAEVYVFCRIFIILTEDV